MAARRRRALSGRYQRLLARRPNLWRITIGLAVPVTKEAAQKIRAA